MTALTFTEKGTPYSPQFEESYFSDGHGLGETNYVFLEGNQLPQRFPNCQDFRIGETGFGTGLNFLLAVDLFLKTAPKTAKLTFVSCELYPLSKEQLTICQQSLTDYQAISEALIRAWPEQWAHQTATLSLFDGRVELVILHGEAVKVFEKIDQPMDAWFLDGFSPAKNPEMWNETVFGHLYRLSAKHTTLATFTAAGTVRRGLVAVGFHVKRIKGYGHKKHMTIASHTPFD